MPFLLDAFRLPGDMFQLFIVADVYCARSGDVLGVMHLFALVTLGTCATRGLLHVRLPQLATRVGISVGVAAVLLIGGTEVFRELEQYRMLAFGAAMVAIMVWRPRGLLAHREPTIRMPPRGPP